MNTDEEIVEYKQKMHDGGIDLCICKLHYSKLFEMVLIAVE